MGTRQASTVLRSAMLAGVLLWTGVGVAQEAANPEETTSLSDSVRELRQQIRELQAAVAEIRSESQRYRAETTDLRRELEAVRGASAGSGATAAQSAPGSSSYDTAAQPAAEVQADK